MIYDVVVGSGFSAIATVCNLVELLPESSSVALVGGDPGFGRGTAYRTELYFTQIECSRGTHEPFSDRAGWSGVDPSVEGSATDDGGIRRKDFSLVAIIRVCCSFNPVNL
ncbi:hypothetical protein EV128_11710 [Rhizobium azibense]|nr:hypothetical protein EV128_11710 [Rhizobium azibense]